MSLQIYDFMFKFDEFWNVFVLAQSRVYSHVLNCIYESNKYILYVPKSSILGAFKKIVPHPSTACNTPLNKHQKIWNKRGVERKLLCGKGGWNYFFVWLFSHQISIFSLTFVACHSSESNRNYKNLYVD